MSRWRLFSVLLVMTAVVGCPRQPDTPASKEKIYDVKGKVMALETDPKKPRVKLDHEDVPGVMEAMKMWFDVEDVKLLQGIKEGDQVHARFKRPDGKNVITELMKH